MEAKLEKRLLTVEEYNKMGEIGILQEKGIELIYGEIIKMSPISSEHSACVDRLSNLFVRLVAGKAIIRVKNPIEIKDHSEPEPDLSLLTFKEDYYDSHHPQPKDVILLIEVAGTSLVYDREIKLPLYAEAGIAEYWIVNLEERQIEAHKEPSGNVYKMRQIARDTDLLKIPGFDISITADKFFN